MTIRSAASSGLLVCWLACACTPARDVYLQGDGPLDAPAERQLRDRAAAAADPADALPDWRRLIRGGIQDAPTLAAGARAAAAAALARPADADDRADLAREGLAWAEAAVALAPADPGARFAHALTLGLLAEASSLEVRPRDVLEAALRLVACDERFEHAGGHRMAGLYYLRAPDLYGGDLDEALAHLTAAVRLAPDLAENHLGLAEALLADDQPEAARQALDEAAALPVDARTAARLATRMAELRARLGG